MHPLVNIGVKAARKAGHIIVQSLDRLDAISIEEKGANDYVTQVDKASEDEIKYIIQKAYPHHAILGEESGLTKPDGAEVTWIIDPLDGTTNFIHGFPQFCISIGVMEKGRVEHGVIYDPLKDELFTASRGHGAKLNDRRIRVSTTRHLEKSLIGTGFPTREMPVVDKYLGLLREIWPKTAGVRRAGAGALDLAYVAAGRLDGFWEYNLKIWDVAAASLMIKEAGGFVTGMEDADSYLKTGNIIAGNPKIHPELEAIIKKYALD